MECKGHHHTSLCMDATNQQSFATRTEFYNPNTGKKTSYSARESRHLLSYYGITCRALLNTGTGSSYTSSMLARELKEPSIRTDYK